MIRLFILIIVMLINISLYSQHAEKLFYTKQRISERNGWINSDNAAGLIFNDINSFSDINTSYEHKQGDLRKPSDAKNETNYIVNTESYQQMKNLFLYGSFTYNFKIKDQIAWNYMLTPYTTAFPFCDSVPGRQTCETYNLVGSFAYALNNNIAAGLNVDYIVMDNAKDKDVRNNNTYMNFVIKPALLFGNDCLRFGANLTYRRVSELINARVFGSGSVYECYDYNYLWYYTPIKLASGGSILREYIDNSFGGGIQFELLGNAMKWYTDFSVAHSVQEVYKNAVLTDRGGESESIYYKGQTKFTFEKVRWSNYLIFNAQYYERTGYFNLQQNEVVDEVTQTVQYGRKRVNSSRYAVANLSYSIYRNKLRWKPSWNILTDIEYIAKKESYYIYPIEEYSIQESVKFGITANKYLYTKSNMFVLGTKFCGYKGKSREDEVVSNDVRPETSSLERNWEVFNADQAFNAADRVAVDASIRYQRIVSSKRYMGFYTDLSWNGLFALNNLYKNKERHNLRVNVGIRF